MANILHRCLAGQVMQRKENEVYEVSDGSEVWVRHANQMKATSIASNENRHILPLGVLLDISEIETPETDRSVSVQVE